MVVDTCREGFPVVWSAVDRTISLSGRQDLHFVHHPENKKQINKCKL